MRVNAKADLKGLENLKKAFKQKKVAKVGILGSTNAREGDQTNAEIGLIHEFGTADGSTPARSFLRMPVENQSKKITEAVGKKKKAIEKAMGEGDMTFAYTQLGIAAEAAVIRAFASGGFGQWEPNKPSTVQQKGSSQPLVDSSQLRDSITSEVVDED